MHDASTGNGPVLNIINATTGTLTVARGGTGATTLTTNGVLLGNTTSAINATAAGTADQVLVIPHAGGAPNFGQVNLAQSAAVTGTLPVANGGTGAASFTDGQLLIGSTAGNTLTAATLTAGTGMSVTNAGGSITLATNLTGGTGITVTGATIATNLTAGTGITVTGATISTNLTAGTGISITGATISLAPLTANNVLLGNGSSAPQTVAPGTNGNILVSNGTTWTSTNTLPETLNMSSAPINTAQGNDIAAASTTNIGAATGNFVNITGTTTITAFDTVQAGAIRILKFAGSLILTYNAVSLILPGAANITTAAGDIATFISLGSGNWVCASYQKAAWQSGGGRVAQIVNTETGAVATGTTTIPFDDTIPQNTEGDQYMSLSITPTNANSTLLIEVVACLSSSASSNNLIAALFQDTTANALAACQMPMDFTIDLMGIVFTHKMTAGTTSSTTFKVRAGGASAGTTTFNGQSGSRRLGGVMASSITITEILP